MKQTQKSIRQEKMNRLAKCFGADTGTKTGVPCRGKYAGTTDYSVTFNNGNRIYICNGMKRFDEYLDDFLKVYEQFAILKNDIMEKLHCMEKRDNEKAKEKNFHHYRLIDVDYVKQDDLGYMGWFYFIIEVNGMYINMITANLSFAVADYCRNGNEIDCISDKYRNNYFVAGGIEESKADFIFGGVGHQSDGDMYRLDGVGFKKMVFIA